MTSFVRWSYPARSDEWRILYCCYDRVIQSLRHLDMLVCDVYTCSDRLQQVQSGVVDHRHVVFCPSFPEGPRLSDMGRPMNQWS